MTRMSIDVPNDLHKMIKFSSTVYDQTIRDFVVEAIRDRLAKKSKLKAKINKTTKRTLDKSDRGIQAGSHQRNRKPLSARCVHSIMGSNRCGF